MTASIFGTWESYIGDPCPECGRIRVEHFSKGFDICEKCGWCVQLKTYIPESVFYDDDEEAALLDEFSQAFFSCNECGDPEADQ